MTEKEWLDIFGKNLARILEESGMSQSELARELMITQSAVSNYINGKRIPTPKVIVNLSYVFDISIENLIDFGKEIL